MEEIRVLSENILKIEVKEEPGNTLEDHESIDVDEPITLKCEVKTESDEEEELQPLATVFLDPKDVTKEEVAEENEDPLAMCDENIFVASEDIKEHSSSLVTMKFTLPFPTSYRCEQAFSVICFMKNKYGNLLYMWSEFRGKLSSTEPNISDIMNFKDRFNISH